MSSARFAAAFAILIGGCSEQVECPKVLASATRLIVVTTAGFDGPQAMLETYERADPGSPWQRRSAPTTAVVGKAGVAWGFGFRSLAKAGEPVKGEGDKRAPAGIFALGPTFGFEPAARPGHMVLAPGAQVCVDDPGSPHYSHIVTSAEAGEGVSGEKMWEIDLYKRGVVVDYPTSGAEKAGSCIFMHVWAGEGQGTAGCVAAPEARIAALQEMAGEGPGAIAIVPEAARKRFGGCLP